MDTVLLMDITSIAREILINVKHKLDHFVVSVGPDFFGRCVAAVAIFFVGKWSANIASMLLAGVLSRAKVDETVSKFLCRIVFSIIICATLLASLEKLGVNTNSLTAVLAAAGLAIGLALQGSLSNFAAGVIIILFRPFKVGDVIEAASTKGVVEEIHIFHTLLHTADNVDIIVPNSEITAGNITNFSSKPVRRIDLIVGCGYGDNLLEVKRFLLDVVSNDERILKDPEPLVAVHELGDNSVNFVVRPWVKNSDYWTVRWSLLEQIKLGFDEQGFSIPFPQRDVHVHSTAITPTTASQPEFDESAAVTTPTDSPKPSSALSTTTAGLLRPRRRAA